jgi:membrane protease YdiL (CAAX protease family)
MRKLTLVEPMLLFGFIVAYIWKLRPVHPTYWIAVPALMMFSHLLRHESARSLGFDLRTLPECLDELGPLLILIVLLAVSAGILLGTLRQIVFDDGLLALAAYLPWGLSQQYALNGYFLNRFDRVFSNRDASFFAALLFSAIHMPNPFLMAVTFPLGWVATVVYRRKHNLFFLGLAHATIGLLFYFVVPDSISRHLRIGPGWFQR